MGMIIMNGKEYTSMPKDGFPPIIYSDEEREIGVWRDGKPLYQKSITFIASASGNTIQVDSNIDTFMFVPSATFTKQANSGNVVNYGFYEVSDNKCQMYYERSTNSIQVRPISSSLVGPSVVTFQYTKTTDIPGSGKYTTYGGLTHHYSTSEQVVGTWIDGKPLYEKTFANVAINTQLLTSIDTVILFRVSTHGAGNNAIYHDTGDGFTKESSKLYTLDNGAVTYISWSGSVVEMEKTADFIICQYTKTTD